MEENFFIEWAPEYWSVLDTNLNCEGYESFCNNAEFTKDTISSTVTYRIVYEDSRLFLKDVNEIDFEQTTILLQPINR